MTYVDADRCYPEYVDHVKITVVGKGEDVDFEIVDLKIAITSFRLPVIRLRVVK